MMSFLTKIANGVVRVCRDGATNIIRNVSPGVLPTDAANVSQLTAITPPYKSYIALISQTGVSAPTAIEIENTLGGTITFSYIGTGNYQLVTSGLFTVNKTGVLICQDRSQAQGVIYAFMLDAVTDANTIVIQTLSDPTNGASGQDGVLYNALIYIIVKN